MKRSTKILITVVLAVGIIGGVAAHGKYQYGDPDRRAAHIINFISEELSLDDTQKLALVQLKDEVLVARKQIHNEMMPVKDEMTELLAADSFDQVRAMEIINSKSATLTQSAPAVIAAFGNFYDGLDAEQKTRIQEFKEHRRGRHGH